MGSDPQFAKYPNLSLAQHIFSLAIAPSSGHHASLQYLQDAIKEHKMAPLYRHLSHPTEGVLNSLGESTSKAPSTPLPTRRGSLVSSNLLPPKKSVQSGLLPWDESVYEELKTDNEKELESIQKEEDDAEEAAGETEVQAARSKRAEFWARVGDKDKAIASYEAVFDKTGPLGTKIDIVLAIIRVGMFFGDKVFVKKQVERANILIESGGDWDRRNRLKAYKGLHLLTVRSYGLAAPLLLDSLSTFTSYELCSYSSLVLYSVLAGSLALKRVDFKAKVVDAPEIKAILGDTEVSITEHSPALFEKHSLLKSHVNTGLTEYVQDKAAGKDEEMTDVSSVTPSHATAVVNLSTLGTGSGVEAQAETPMDFTALANLVNSLYHGDYQKFFLALASVEENFLTQDRYLFEHRAWFVREMRLRSYQQLLQSYRVVGLDTMAKAFGVSVDFLDRDLAKFIAGDRIPCTIDRVKGVIETTRPDDKNKQYADVVKHGDALITKLQKYGQAVRLRGSERA